MELERGVGGLVREVGWAAMLLYDKTLQSVLTISKLFAFVVILLQLSTGIKTTEFSRAVTVSYAFGLASCNSERLLNDRARFESATQTA